MPGNDIPLVAGKFIDQNGYITRLCRFPIGLAVGERLIIQDLDGIRCEHAVGVARFKDAFVTVFRRKDLAMEQTGKPWL